MKEIIDLIGLNIVDVGLGALLFVLAYVSNMLMSTFYNVKTLEGKFSFDKMLCGLEKIIVLVFGISLLCVVVTTLPLFAVYAGFDIPEEYTDVFNILVIVGSFLVPTCKYTAEAISKLSKILNGGGYDEMPL